MEIHEERLLAYQERATLLNRDAIRLAKGSTTFSILRLVVFIAAVALTIFVSSYGTLYGTAAGIIGLAIFLVVVKKHHLHERKRNKVSIEIALVKNEVNAISKRQNTYYDGSKFVNHEHSYSTDLDVFGPFSLFGLINRCKTYHGNKILSEYLSINPSISEIHERQTLIRNLENEIEWKLTFLTSLYEIEEGHETDIAVLVNRILEGDLSFATGTMLSLYRKSLPVIWIGTLILYFTISNWGIILAIFVGLINMRVTMVHASAVSEIQYRLSKAGRHLDKYATALSLIASKKWPVDLENGTSDLELKSSTNSKVSSLSKLKKLADLLDYRLHMIPSFLLNVGFLWDTLIVSRIAQWRHSNQFLINGVFELIGKVEAMTSLSIWSHNHPHFTYAAIDDSYFHLEGVQMRHPLLAYDECMPNDFKISPSDKVNIITGSNMSGKSTFLRTLGLNLVLAYAGTKVAAEDLKAGLVSLFTYMRIKDALEENVSTFKAELDRIERILKLMSNQEPIFILADEMLRGTNSLDKLKGSKAILLKILVHESYAAVATHDIGLTDLANSYPNRVNNYYFDIDYQDGELRFDYKIKPGVCQNFNASYLLGKLGIDVDGNKSLEL